MSLINNHHYYYRFFKNKEMNELYFSYGIFNFSLGLISIFEPIYFYKLGYSIPFILFYFFLISLFFVIFSFLGARAVSFLGVKRSMQIAMPISMAYFIGLKFVPGSYILFFILPLIKAIKMMFYNYSFHLNFIEHSDVKNRGREVSIVQASALLAGVLAPVFGGFIIKFFNFPVLFSIGSLFIFFAALPLFFSSDTHEKIYFDKKRLFFGIFKKDNLPLFYSFSGYAVESWIGFIIWPIFLFLILYNVETVGLIASLTTVLTVLIFYLIGKETDRGDKKALLKIGTILYFFGWLGRIFVNGFMSVFLIDTYKNVTQHILYIPWSAYSYDIAAKSDYFKFIVRREIIFNLSRIIAIPFLIVVFAVNYHPFAVSFLIAAVSCLLYTKLNKVILNKNESPVIHA